MRASALRNRFVAFVERDTDADVLVVTNMWPDAARPVYGIFVKRQIDSVRARGVRCDVMYIRGYLSPLAYIFAAAQLLAASLRWRNRYRLMHVHAGETALVARCFVGPPMLVSYCGDDVMGDPRDDGRLTFASRVRAAVIRRHAATCTATITKSHEMHDQLPARVQRSNTVLPNGVDDTLFVPHNRGEARRVLGWDLDERVVLFAATKPGIPRKRRWLAEEACSLAAERLGPVRLLVSGLTPPDDMPLLMSASDCLIHTASLEGSPNVVKEALMCNLPVIATPSGDVSELLRDVQPSYLCPPDAHQLADALVEFLSAPTRSNGRARIESELSATAVATRLVAIYDEHADLDTSRVATHGA